MQALFLLALDPVAETTADGGSYGFRNMRRCADAIERCFANLARKGSPKWVLEGDIKGCFDNIDHQWLIDHVPMNKTVLVKWLKSGFMEKQVYHSTIAGTPQGGIISPVLANLTLDGLEHLLRKQYPRQGKGSGAGKAAKVHWVFSGLYRDTVTVQVMTLRLINAQSIKIVRHRLVASALNPYDTNWADYARARTSRLTAPATSFHSGV
ncbi:reverse transcriptase/maturase family protein [Pantoea sp. VS1]|uniref:reverse transcriptase/maturase family protein n=1 Tax=Pantoea sp. VS1 TaxID=2003658 RepID=UPI0020CCBA5D|nr:reverse transcriptase/maturase family protein [Pantoea sp. VS1]